jgi:hypothetical protein
MNISTKVMSIVMLLCITLFASSTASAKDKIDGSANLLCAAFDVSACLEGGGMRQG